MLMIDHLTRDYTEVFFTLKQVLFHCLSMLRCVSKRSSLSVDLASSSLGRAGRAGRHCPVCWSELATSQTATVRWTPQLGERALQEHILQNQELLHGVRLLLPGWWRLGETIARPRSHTRRSSTPALFVPKRQHCKTLENPCRPHRARLVPRHVGPVENRTAMGHAAVHVRGPALVPRDIRRDQPEHSVPLETERTLLSPTDMTRLSDHIMRVSGVLCLSAVTIRGLVHEWFDTEGLDVRPT